MNDLIVSIVEWILEFIANFFGSACQFIAGIIFDSIGNFMGSNQNIIIKILSPVYNFSINYLMPFSIGLLAIILVANLLITMFGKYSSSRDEPITLVVRGIFFAILIMATPALIGLIGGTAMTGNNKNESGIVLQMTSAMSDIGTNKDVNGQTGLTSVKNSEVNKDIKKTLSNGKDNVNDFIGYSADKSDSDNGGSTYTAKKNTDKDTIGSTISDAGMNSGDEGGFAVFIIGILGYVIIYCVMVLIMAWKCLKICSRFVYRFVIFLVILYMAPVTLACGPSKSTQKVFGEWLRMVVSYAVLLIATAAFMRIGLVVIYLSFHYSASTSLMQVIFSFLVSIMFLKMIFDLERYVEKLGLTAVGLPDSVSGLSRQLGSTANMLKYSLMREGVRSALSHVKDIPNKMATPKDPNTITNKQVREAFGQGVKDRDEKGNEVDTLATEMLGKDNDNAFVKDPNGDCVMGTDGIMHDISEFEEQTDKDGNKQFVLSEDKSVMPEDQSMQDRCSSISDSNIDTKELDGMDSTSGAFTNVENENKDSAFIQDDSGDYYMAQSADGNVSVNKADLDDSNTTEYALKSDNEGNFKAVKWNSEDDGDKYRVGNNGNLVNIGNGQRFSYTKSSNEGAIPVKYKTTSKDTSKAFNAKSNRIDEKIKYNSNLPDGAKISAINNLKFCREFYKTPDGTTIGLAKQTLIDSKTGKPTGQSRDVKVTIYENNEINRGKLAEYRRNSNRNNLDRNPCEGDTPDGKYYIHIDKYMGEHKQSIIWKYKGA